MSEDTPLHEAVRYEDVDETRKLLVKGCYDINQIGIFQWSCLHEAAAHGLHEILMLLLRFGADVDVQDLLKGYTALHYSAESDDLKSVEALINHNAQIDILSKDGLTVIDVAVGESRDFLLRKAPLLVKKERPCYQDSSTLIHSISKVSNNSTDIFESQSSDAGSVSDYDTNCGQVELSFEYNSKKGSLKIRVWSLFDLLMPPANHSPISMLFMRGQIKRSKHNYLKATTETVKAYPESADKAPASLVSDENVTFIPVEAIYHFDEPMHFPNVEKDIIAKEKIEIFLFVRARRSPKTFAVSRLELPLKEAVRKLSKKVYSLKPLSSAKTPANVKLYGNASILRSVKARASSTSCASNPSLRHERLAVFSHDMKAISASDSNLQSVRCVDQGSDQVSLEMHSLEDNISEVKDAVSDFSVYTVPDSDDLSQEPIIGESTLISVTVHKPTPSDAFQVDTHSSSYSMDVPFIQKESEDDSLNEVISGGHVNPTLIGSVEYLMPPITRSPLSSDLRVHQSARATTNYPQEDDIELVDLG